MLFVTESFLVFFIIVFLVYWAAPQKLRFSILLISSLIFYASWSLVFTLHFIVVIGINYYTMEIVRTYRKKWLFVLLQTANICNLAFFKYFYFFADIIGALTGLSMLRQPLLQLEHRTAGHEILLPLAISFYTFQIMAYGFDIYRGVYTTKHKFREVLLFKAFFPQLIAGPIMRSAELLPQISSLRNGELSSVSSADFKKGLWLILIGVVKKVLVANQLLGFLAPLLVFDPNAGPRDYSTMSAWMFVTGSMMMLYTDFSAYSDLARGLGLLLGFKIPVNFRAPFITYSISEFWRRWHLTFSLWIRDYIFIPLGGSRVSEYRIYLNIVITFFLGGLWHGASYTFVLWGLCMGLFISFESLMTRHGYPEWPAKLPARAGRIALTWIFFICVSALFFAPNLGWALDMLARMFYPSSGPSRELASPGVYLATLCAVILFHWFEEKPAHFSWVRKYENYFLPAAALAVVAALTQFAGPQKDFFYFQF